MIFLDVGSNPNKLHLLVNPQVSSKKLTASWKQVPRRSPSPQPTPSHKKTHYLARRSCPGQDNFFPDRYVLRFGELSLWTGHREEIPCRPKNRKDAAAAMGQLPTPLTAPVK